MDEPFRVGEYTVEPQLNRIRRDDRTSHVEPKVMDVLVYLAKHPKEVLSKERVIQAVWSDAFVTDDVLTHAISELRKALDDDAKSPWAIETFARRGYRLVASVSNEVPGEPTGVQVTLPAPSRFPPGVKRWLLRGLMGVSLLVAGSLYWFYSRFDSPLPPFAARPLTTYGGLEVHPSLSPDGNKVAFSWDGERNNYDIYVQLIGAGEPIRLTEHPATDFSPTWSPDGRFIAFLRQISRERAAVFWVPALGGAERKLADIYGSSYLEVGLVNSTSVAWSPDGKSLVVSDKESPEQPYALFSVSTETREKRRLTTSPPGSLGDRHPAFSPAGDSLTFSRFFGTNASELYMLALTDNLIATGEPEQITLLNRRASNPAWMPDGREIIFCSGAGLWRVEVHGSRETQQLAYVGEGASGVTVARLLPRMVYSRSISESNIWRLQLAEPGAAAAPPEKLIHSTRTELSPAYSPDGSRIAFHSSRSGTPEIWVCNGDGSKPDQLTSFGGPLTGSPRWSPDGLWIAFDSRAEGQGEIYVIRAQGGTPRRLTTEAADDCCPSWSRNGKWIYFSSSLTRHWGEVSRIPAEGGKRVQVTREGGDVPFESPDGKFLYYVKFADTISLWRAPVGGGEETRLVDSLAMLESFAVVDEGVYFIPGVGPDEDSSVNFLSFATGTITRVASIGKPSYGFAVSPDGRSILYAQKDHEGNDLMLVENFH